MSYRTYTTEALVCGNYINNTSDKSFLLFTRQAGMLYATARSVREERSKQRYALQLFSLINISLIRGKNGWRVGSVDPLGNYWSATDNRLKRSSLITIVKLIRQYIHGEEINYSLYDEVLAGIRFLTHFRPKEKRTLWETLIKVRILYKLGYIAPPDDNIHKLLNKKLIDITDKQITDYHLTYTNLFELAKYASHLNTTSTD